MSAPDSITPPITPANPPSRFLRPESFELSRSPYNYSSLDAALIEIFRPDPDIRFNAQALEFTLTATSLPTSGPHLVDSQLSEDKIEGVQLDEAGDRLQEEKWFTAGLGYQSETSRGRPVNSGTQTPIHDGATTSRLAADSEQEMFEVKRNKQMRVIEILDSNPPMGNYISNPIEALLGTYLKLESRRKLTIGSKFSIPDGLSVLKEENKPAIVNLRIPFLAPVIQRLNPIGEDSSVQQGRGAVEVEDETDALSWQEYNTTVLKRTKLDLGDAKEFVNGEPSNITMPLISQLWITAVNNRVLLVYGGKNYTRRRKLPLLAPFQSRLGAYLAMAHILSKTLCQLDQKIIEEFTRQLANLHIEATMEEIVYLGRNLPANPTTNRSIDELYKEAAISQAKLGALHGMVERQIQVLKELTQFFELTIHEERGATRRYSKDWIFVNGISQCKEQVISTLTTLRATTNDRETTAKSLGGLSDSFRALIFEFIQRSNARKVTEATNKGFKDMLNAITTQSKQNDRVADSLIAQTKQQEALNEEIAHQGRGISLFTVVATVFLPLGFFSSYYALDFTKETVEAGSFWRLTGTLTGVFLMICVYVVLISRWEKRRIVQWVWDALTKWGLMYWPASREEISNTEIHLRLLPKYQVCLVSTDSSRQQQRLYLQEPKSTQLTQHAIKRSLWSRTTSLVRRQPPSRLRLQTTENSDEAGTFRYDKAQGWLYLKDPEPLYNLMHRAHCSQRGQSGFSWKAGQNQMNHEPFRFKSHFKSEAFKIKHVQANIPGPAEQAGGISLNGLKLRWVTLKEGCSQWWTTPNLNESWTEYTEEFVVEGGVLRLAKAGDVTKYWICLLPPITK